MNHVDAMPFESPDAAVESMSEDDALPDLIGESTISEEEEEDDDDNDDFETTSMVIMSDDAGQVYAPPARIAARFYRDSKSGHYKSSATSSRRNSLSSIHSHTRSLRRSSTSQSSYVAQHLRRTSILEARKARLADRAAHAERVRLRAALAKAAPRDGRASEERAMAAQLAREKYLAKVAATCAEEVQKAKQKAQDMKARKLEEERQARLDMDERMAEADRRRAEYKRNLNARRSRRASSQEKKLSDLSEDGASETRTLVLDEATAATRIQRAWRLNQRKMVIQGYLGLDISLQALQRRSFEDIGALLSQAATIQATTKVLRFFGLEHAESNYAQNTRTFLSAYLIVIHPASVLSKQGTQEQDLMAKARDLVVSFESAMSRLAQWNKYTASTALLQDLSQAYSTYTSAFGAWRAQDSTALIETMVASFIELDAIWQTVKDDTQGEVAGDYRQGIRDNQVMLLSKIRKLAGPDRADFLIKKAIRESRRRRVKHRSPAEVRPRAAADADTEAATAEPSDAMPMAQLPSPHDDLHNTAESQDEVRMNLARLFSPIPGNRVLTHELAIDKEFRIAASAHSSIRDTLNRELCESMRTGFERGLGSLWTVAMAQEIRSKITRIVKPGNPMYNVIVESLDTDLIWRQCEQGMFSYANFFSFMANILPKLCAPFRDEEVKTLANDLLDSNDSDDRGAMIEKLFRLLHFIDLLSLDYQNFLLMTMAPVLIRESAGYESRMFAADLAAGTITLEQTNRWWRNASINIFTEADGRDPEQVRNLADRPTAHRIYTRGLVDMAIGQGSLSESDVPETLALDFERLLSTRLKALQMATIGAILLVAKNLLKRDVRGAWKPEAARLWDLLSKEWPLSEDESGVASLAARAFGILDNAHNLPPSTKAALQSSTSRLITQAVAQRFTDPVARVLFNRLKGHVLSRVAAKSSSERVRAASGASEALTSAGLPEFVTQVGEMVEMLRRVAEVDWAAHGTWYDVVAREVNEVGS